MARRIPGPAPGGARPPAGAGWCDVTRPIRPGMGLYPGDPPVRFRPHAGIPTDGFAVTGLELGTHTGTHVDAPSHLIEGAPPVDRLPLGALCGPARLAAPPSGPLDAAGLARLDLEGAERLLIRALPDGPSHLTPDGAALLAARGLLLLGWERLSVDPQGSAGLPAHRALLAAGVVLAEGLDLSGLEPGAYDLVCLPLRLEGLDGSPARVLVRPA